VSEELLILASCLQRPMSRNSVLEESELSNCQDGLMWSWTTINHMQNHTETHTTHRINLKSAASYQLTDSPSTAYNPNKYRTANSRTLSWSFSVCRAASWSADVKAGVFLSRSFSARVFSTIFFSTATAFSSCSGVRPLSPI